MELSGAYEQTPAQTASQAWRYVVAQATGILMARLRINSESAFARLASTASDERRPLVAVARERGGGQQVGVRSDQVYWATAAPSIVNSRRESRPSGRRLARFSDFRAVPLALEPGHVLIRSTRCFHDDAGHLTHAQTAHLRSFAEDLVAAEPRI